MADSGGEGPIHVLSVSADSDLAGRLETALPAHGDFRVRTATTVADALERLRNGPTADCIVSDHDLPDFDGITFLQAVRAEWTDLPFILFTGEGSESVASRAISAQVTDYLIKDAVESQAGHLAALISQAVAYHRARVAIGVGTPRAEVVLEGAADLMAIVVDGDVAYMNDVGLDRLGLDGTEDLQGTPFEELVAREQSDALAQVVEQVLRGESIIERVETAFAVGGDTYPIELTVTRITWRDELAVLVVSRDIGDRREMESELREMRRITAVIREIHEVLIRSTDRAELERAVCERFVAAEPYMFAWIGATDQDSASVWPRVAAGAGGTYLDDVEITTDLTPPGRGPTGAAFRSGEPQVMQNVLLDERYAPWQEAAAAYGFRSSAAFPLQYDEMAFGVLNLYADRPFAFGETEVAVLTELADDIAFSIASIETRGNLAAREDELSSIRDRLSVALSAARAGVWQWTIETDEVIWDESCERLFGLEPGSFEGTIEGFTSRVHAEDLEDLEAELETVLETGDPLQTEFRIVREDGQIRWIRAHGEVRTTGENGSRSLIGVDVDISELKERELHLKVLDRVLRHNLHNDMNVIGGFAETIKREGDETVAQYASYIIEQAEQLVATADKEREIVAILSSTAGSMTVDLPEFVERAVARATQRFSEATIECTVPASGSVTVNDRFDRVFDELIENAVIHSAIPEPTVEIDVEVDPTAVRIVFRDEGPRIPEMNVTVLAGDRSIEPLYHGSGLGLWLVNWIVYRSDGTISFEWNEATGNEITVSVPPVSA